MIYEEWLKKNRDVCPFCELKKSDILKENKSFYLIPARAAYVKDHLLVVPKKHKIKISQLNKKEFESLNNLVFYAFKKLNKKYQDASILYREGDKKKIGKSIDHLHIHIIPKMKIGSINSYYKPRKRLEDLEYQNEVERIRRELF